MNQTILKYIGFITVTTCLFAVQSCQKADDFLDSKSTNEINKETVFSDSLRTVEFMSGIYTRLGFGTNSAEVNSVGGLMSEATDEAETRWPGAHNVPNQIFGGTFATAFYDKIQGEWSYFYTGIRHVNLLLENVDAAPIPTVIKERYKLEARFLRAYFYHYMLRYWGGVPLVGDKVFQLSDINDAKRATYEECVDYIVSELNAIAPQLPVSYSAYDYGRITKGAALALKSRLLLAAASPLFNGGSVASDAQVVPLTAYPAYDANRWQKALDAAKEVINLNQYQLYVDNQTKPGYGFYQVFLKRVNPEYILATMLGYNRNIESATNPPSRGGSYLRYPSQQLVDAFPMVNGKPIHAVESGYDEQQPYVNRDPRFYSTIIFNGSLYFDTRTNRMDPVYTYEGAALDGIKAVTANTGTNTGYYARKWADENIPASSAATTERCPPIFRYAEVLLNYAEASVELGQIEEGIQQIMALRARAGIQPGRDNRYGIAAKLNMEEARHIVRNERFIELAFEEHRYWDVRRWRIGEQFDGYYIKGMRIVKNANNTYTYNRINVRAPRYFKDNSYLFPIPLNEIAVNRNILQNPGW